jgi:hypothetical protein
MQKEEFLKEVTALFSTSKIVELNNFLNDNKEQTIEHKKFIKSLNKELGNNEVILSTLTSFEKEQRENKKAFRKSVDEALKANNETLFFELINTVSVDEKFDISSTIYNRDNIYIKLQKNIIDNKEQLSEKNQQILRHYSLECGSLSKLNDVGAYYCNKTKDIKDEFSFLKKKLDLTISDSNISHQEKEKEANQFFDFLDANKDKDESLNPITYFSRYLTHYLYLNDSSLKKLGNENTNFALEKIIGYVANEQEALNYYLEKQSKDFKLHLSFNSYLNYSKSGINNDKFVINKEPKFTSKDFENKITRNPKIINLFVSDDKIKEFLSGQEEKISIDDNSTFLKSLLVELNKKEVEEIFNKSDIFQLGEKTQAIINDYLNNYEKHIINTLNGKEITVNNKGIEEYIEVNINNNEFFSNLNTDGKKSVILRYIDFSKIEDTNKFINNFLQYLPIEEYSCFHGALSCMLDNNQNKEGIMRYILNEKTKFSPHSIYYSIEIFHFLNDEKKSELVNDILKEKQNRNNFIKYSSYLEKDLHLTEQERANLTALKNLYNKLFIQKENANAQHKKYKSKKK